MSAKIAMGVVIGPNNSERRFPSQIASFAAWVSAMYLASVVDKEMVSCHLDDQDTALPFNIKTYPDIACLSS